MKKLILTLLMGTAASAQSLLSPSKQIQLEFKLVDNGKPTYTLTYKGRPVIEQSLLGLTLERPQALESDFKTIKAETATGDETWTPVLGEQSRIRNHYNELKVQLLQTTTERKMNIVFRLYDEGLAFRYEFPNQYRWKYFKVTREVTEFNLTGDHKAFWIPGDFDSQEYVYSETPLSAINGDQSQISNGIGFKGPMEQTRVQSPLMMKTKDGLYINIFEAAVINYPVMHLNLNPKTFSFRADLAPNAIGDLAYLETPCKLPWRTVMVSDDAKDIVGSRMILNLNDPSKISDVSWIKPIKYVGIWWEMHVGKSTWDYAGSQNAQNAQPGVMIPTGKHGATTANAKKYIDFAANNGFDGVLIEGWNVGWEDWFGNWKEEVFDFVTPYPDFDVKEVTDYAKSKNVQIIMHHETSGSVSNYERRLDRAYDFMEKYGYKAVKTGYVGRIIPRGEWHDGQTMVNHFNWVVQRAAERKIMVNSHESSRPTGVHRTWPNYVSAEAARGNEFNAWSTGNPPMHETILPFTRLLGGPMDYTPGIFEIKMSAYEPSKKEQIHTTLAKQLALYVTMYSPIQMAADLPENYEKHQDAFQFIKDVAADWDDTKILEAEPGDYVTIARKAKGKDAWFVGAITDENARKSTIFLDFLPTGKKYKATIYEDGKDADWEKNPKSYAIKTIEVDSKSKINLNLAAGGGTAISIFPAK
ncbi:glycoside hydrolase family 97 protein [Flavobacterium sp. MAH-1]|uniref:Glycoside hydrolase family 97 protein n=1 Tax=Flavobacterium agri TaxID=2743471 RepID=A0A7Y8XYR8_9FLAO|nr:glycoside hydrolase family 97 protein [Flavobacterium agri]NUY79392.1 glycoside hydrolase family 97 protein [Flavobacterium agri]NYA69417.1 glycoside hydrolase family 97 protein [Flavobacterium agri]